MRVLAGHTGTVTSCAFNPQGTLLATTSGDWDKTARLWDPRTGALVRVLERQDDWITGCAFRADGSILVTWSGAWTVRSWNPNTGRERRRRAGRRRPSLAPTPDRGYAVSPDGALIVTTRGGWDSSVQVLDPTTGGVVRTLEGHAAWVHGCAFSPDGTLVATASGDGTACVWDPRTGALLARLEGHLSWVTGCAFSPDGTLVATTSADHTARLWPLAADQVTERSARSRDS